MPFSINQCYLGCSQQLPWFKTIREACIELHGNQVARLRFNLEHWKNVRTERLIHMGDSFFHNSFQRLSVSASTYLC